MSTSNPKKKKTLFQKAMDALTNRDEKEAAEAAKQAAHDAELKAMADAQAAKMAREKTEEEVQKQHEEEAARKKEQALADQRAAEERLEEEEERKRAQIKAQAAHESQAAAVAAAQAPRFIAEHTVQPDETLSHIALKYYGNATRPYWEVIHAANIETIPNAGMIKPGQVLNIPELPEELKK
jgi:nucleoid-associated protein YgaU